MTMNLTGFDLKEGQRIEIRIVDEAAEAKVKADNEAYLKQLIQEIIDEALDTDDDSFSELDSAFEPYTFTDFNYDIPHKTVYKNLYKSVDIPKYYYPYYDEENDPGYEFRMLVKKWKETDFLRWQLYQEHSNMPSDQVWNSDRFRIGDRVELYWFLDEVPGYAYMKGQKGTIISAGNKKTLNYVTVQFDGMNNQVQVLPGVLKKIHNGSNLPKLINIDLIRTDHIPGYGWDAWVEGYRQVWEFGDDKNTAIHKLLATWYHNIKNQ